MAAIGLAGLLVVGVTSHAASDGTTAPAAAQAAAATTAPAAVSPEWMRALTEAARAHRHRFTVDGDAFAGPGWELLLAEGRAAHFFLLGEEHGIAEAPRLAGQLFETLAKDGYSKFVVEVSPPRADALDRAARGGMAGLAAQLKSTGGGAAFFTMQEEAEMLARVRAAVPGDAPVLWGVDYEVFGDRLLIAELERMDKPAPAQRALARLREASDAAWATHAERRDPGAIFTFSGDPDRVAAVRAAWPDAPPAATRILRTLQATLEINALWVKGQGYASNVARATLLRENLLAHWKAERAAGRLPRVFAKLGASHLMRGRSATETYDLGALIPELAALEGVGAVQVAILPGRDAAVAVFDPVAWTYRTAAAKDGYGAGLEPLYEAAFEDGFTLVDLRPLRAALGARGDAAPGLMRMVHGFDLLLLMTGSTASTNLR